MWVEQLVVVLLHIDKKSYFQRHDGFCHYCQLWIVFCDVYQKLRDYKYIIKFCVLKWKSEGQIASAMFRSAAGEWHRMIWLIAKSHSCTFVHI